MPSQPNKGRGKGGKAASATKAQIGEADRIEIDYEQLKTLTKIIQLNGIYLLDGGIQSHADPRTTAPGRGPKAYMLHLSNASWWLDGSALDVVLGYRVAGNTTREAIGPELFTVNAKFLVSYLLPEGGAPVPSESNESLFADLVAANGQINVFPYLRQFVNDVTARAGWPPLVLSVFKAPARRPRRLVRMARAWDHPARSAGVAADSA